MIFHTELSAQVGRDVLIAERVMTRVGHAVRLWELSDEGTCILTLHCQNCNAAAHLHIVTLSGGQDVPVLILPRNQCPAGTLAATEEVKNAL